jgi:hypothetical protein
LPAPPLLVETKTAPIAGGREFVVVMGGIELKIYPIVLNGFFSSSVLLGTRKITRICCTALLFLNAEFSAFFRSKISQFSVAFLPRKVNAQHYF